MWRARTLITAPGSNQLFSVGLTGIMAEFREVTLMVNGRPRYIAREADQSIHRFGIPPVDTVFKPTEASYEEGLQAISLNSWGECISRVTTDNQVIYSSKVKTIAGFKSAESLAWSIFFYGIGRNDLFISQANQVLDVGGMRLGPMLWLGRDGQPASKDPLVMLQRGLFRVYKSLIIHEYPDWGMLVGLRPEVERVGGLIA